MSKIESKRKDKKVLFKYQLHVGYVSYRDWFLLQFHVLCLRLRRLLRFLKRCVTYSVKLLPLIMLLAVSELVIVPVGIEIGKFSSVYDAMWDIRWIVCNSIFIPLFINIIQNENHRRNELRKQFNTYKTFMFDTEFFILRLCRVFGMDSLEGDLLSEEGFDKMLKHIMSYNFEKGIKKTSFHIEYPYDYDVERITYLDIQFSVFMRRIESITNIVSQNDFIGRIDHFMSQMNDVNDLLISARTIMLKSNDNYSDNQIKQFISLLLRSIYPAIADIRRPWRWDIDRNNRIQSILIGERE